MHWFGVALKNGLLATFGDHAASRNRRSIRSRPVRPNICRLSILSRLICPLVCPGSPDRTGTDSLQADKSGTLGGCQGGQGCRAAPESPETVGVKFAVAGPEVIAGEIDVAPAQGREMGKDCLRHWDAVPT